VRVADRSQTPPPPIPPHPKTRDCVCFVCVRVCCPWGCPSGQLFIRDGRCERENMYTFDNVFGMDATQGAWVPPSEASGTERGDGRSISGGDVPWRVGRR
jgi:hypothetical protein